MHPPADRRRQALFDFLKSRNLTKGALARETGISPNIIYNFLGGKSSYLSQPTLERIAAHYAVPISVLTGGDTAPEPYAGTARLNEPDHADLAPPPGSMAAGLVSLVVAGTVMGKGIWTETLFTDAEAPHRIMLPIAGLYAKQAFAVRLSATAVGAHLPPGAFLGCIALKNYLRKPASGDLVLAVQRNRIGLFECSVRAYRVEGSRHFLTGDLENSRSNDRVELRSPLADPAAPGYQDMFMHSVVLSYAVSLPASG